MNNFDNKRHLLILRCDIIFENNKISKRKNQNIMGLPKGRTNNAKGRKPGVLNKMNQDLKQTIVDFLESKWPEIEAAFDKFSQKEKVHFYLELLQYRLPKIARKELTGRDGENLLPARTLSKQEALELWNDLENGNFEKVQNRFCN